MNIASKLSPASDEQIILQFFSDDELALEKLFAKYYRALTIYVMKFVGDVQVAEDIVQDIIIRFWEDEKYATITSSLRNYLFTSARNRSLNYLESFHHLRQEPLTLEEFKNMFEVEELDDDELLLQHEKLKKELANLPEKMQKVLRLIVFEGKKYKVVAEELDISLNTVKTHYKRGLKRLRSILTVFILLLFDMIGQ